MFKILDGRSHFYQWDLDRKLIVLDKTINKVYFCNRMSNCSIVRNVYEVNGMRLVDVPNIVLQESFKMNVYGFDKNYTKHSAVFEIIFRTRPEDYVYTEEELKVWDELEERVAALEQNGGYDMEQAIKEYNVITNDMLNERLTEYLTDDELDNAIAAIPQPDMSGYYTKTEIDNKGYLTAHQDLSAYALKTDIPNTASFITMAQVESKGYQTETQVNTLINTALGVIENGSY